MKSSTYLFHVKTKILVDFQICISVPLRYKFLVGSGSSAYTVLDCIFDEANRTFWMLDLMCYKDTPLYDTEVCASKVL